MTIGTTGTAHDGTTMPLMTTDVPPPPTRGIVTNVLDLPRATAGRRATHAHPLPIGTAVAARPLPTTTTTLATTPPHHLCEDAVPEDETPFPLHLPRGTDDTTPPPTHHLRLLGAIEERAPLSMKGDVAGADRHGYETLDRLLPRDGRLLQEGRS